MMERKGKKSKGKAAGGDRYDVMLTGGGDQRLAVAKVFNEISGMRRVGAELQEIFSRPTPIKEGSLKMRLRRSSVGSRMPAAR
jgi:hypothetical protein